ncbi:MAG: DUF3592 domain-containing protein [Pyrinomonadaceae bacterium]
MGILDRFRNQPKVDLEKQRREHLLVNGRITDGTIIESETTAAGEELVYYFYSVQGTDFESSEILTEEQKYNPIKYAPGAKVGVRFDPKQHTNSMLV